MVQKEPPGICAGWMKMERNWLFGGVSFWREAVGWSWPSLHRKAWIINFISLGHFPSIKSKWLGQVVLFSSKNHGPGWDNSRGVGIGE